MKNIILLLILGCTLTGCFRSPDFLTEYDRDNSFDESFTLDSFDDGYDWAADNDIDNFDDCQYEFGTSDAEDGCNGYVKENYSGYNTFYGYDCTEDCSGHQVGYDWAENNDISDIYDCDGNSQSFIEGCEAYVYENY